MTPNSEGRQAKGELRRLEAAAIESLVDRHPGGLCQALQQYGGLLVSSDIATIMIRREEKLSRQNEDALKALREIQVYGRNWGGLLRLLIDLLTKGERP